MSSWDAPLWTQKAGCYSEGFSMPTLSYHMLCPSTPTLVGELAPLPRLLKGTKLRALLKKESKILLSLEVWSALLLNLTHSFPSISELGCCIPGGGATSDPHKLEGCLDQRSHTVWSEWMKTSHHPGFSLLSSSNFSCHREEMTGEGVGCVKIYALSTCPCVEVGGYFLPYFLT